LNVVSALVNLELRRQRPIVLRMVLLTLFIGVVFFVAGKRTPASLFATLLGCSLGVVLIVPMGISRDKMEGTLDFICGLPVEPRDIAASRFIAVALLAIPWATGVGVLSATGPAIGALNPVGAAVLTWLTMVLLGICATALMTRYDLETLLGAPIIAMAIVVVIVPRVVHSLIPGITPETALQLLTRPAAPPLLATALLVAIGAIGTVAFAVTTRGFANYRPGTTSR
jgi:hypothetical protein